MCSTNLPDMRFIFLSAGYHPDQLGGAYRYVAEVTERLAARGHRVTVIHPGNEGQAPVGTSTAGVTLQRLPRPRGFFWNNWRQKNRAARRALQVATAGQSGPLLTLLCHAYFAPAMAGQVGASAYLFTGPWAQEYLASRPAARAGWPRRALDRLVAARMRVTERRALRQADRILTISRYYEGQLPRWHGAGLPPIQQVSGGVNTEQFFPVADRPAARARFGLKPDEFLFLTVRRLERRMGLRELIAAFAPVARQQPHARLWLAGEGSQRNELQACLDSYQLADCVRLLGFVAEAELPALYNAADCTLMPSLELEGFGLATVESLACGTPVVGSRTGATPELLAPLDETLLFDAVPPTLISEKLLALLQGRQQLPARGQCRDYVVQHFSWSRTVSGFEQAFTELCGTGGPA